MKSEENKWPHPKQGLFSRGGGAWINTHKTFHPNKLASSSRHKFIIMGMDGITFKKLSDLIFVIIHSLSQSQNQFVGGRLKEDID